MNKSTMKKQLIAEIKIDGFYDGYGVCMGWIFSICDYIESVLEMPTPADWQFRQSPFGPDTEASEYQILVDLAPDINQLMPVALILLRYKALLKAAGKDY